MKKILCVLAGYDPDTEQILSGIQRHLYNNGFTGSHTKDLLQHITLCTCSPDQEEELIKKMTQAAELPSFGVTFNHIGIFGGSKVLFIAPDPNLPLLQLREKFAPSENWTPHTTMLIDEPDTICRAVPFVSEKFSAFSGQVESLHLYEFWPTRHILSISLR